MNDFIVKYRDFILFTIGTLLVIISIILLSYDKFVLLKSNVFDEIQMEKDREGNELVDELLQSITEEITVDNVDAEDVQDQELSQERINYIKREYIGYLEIPKINMKNGLVSKNSFYNNVNYNIQMLKESDYPDAALGNVILAAHSGTSYISYFKNLYKLSKGDEAIIYYKDYIYRYKIVDIYNVPKNGYATIKRNAEKSCLTLITCTRGSDTEQTIYILELTSSSKDGE